MLNLLDLLLRDLFIATVPGIATDAQVGFQPPNDDWHAYVANQGAQLALNVYLIDLREDRKLRMNDRVRTVQNGTVSETPASIKMDCHYLISAWSPAKPAPGVEPALDEHSLLFSVVATLSGQQSLNPSRVYPAASPQLNAWPVPYRDREMLMMYLPVEGFRQFAEFWQTMGSDRPWKPAVHVVVTLPVPQPTFVMGGIVTTWLAEVALENGSGAPICWSASVAWCRITPAHRCPGPGSGSRRRRSRPPSSASRSRPAPLMRSAGSHSTGWAAPATSSAPRPGPGRGQAEHRGPVDHGELRCAIPLGPPAARRAPTLVPTVLTLT